MVGVSGTKPTTTAVSVPNSPVPNAQSATYYVQTGTAGPENARPSNLTEIASSASTIISWNPAENSA